MRSAAGVAGRLARVLLLAIPFVVTLGFETRPVRANDVVLSRHAVSPQRIHARVGERVRLNVISVDDMYGLDVKELGVNACIPGGGTAVTIDLTAWKAGLFTIVSSDHCGRSDRHMSASPTTTPGT